MNEQESKAQQHLFQLSLLAAALNRILVLPNVRHGRFGACLARPFETYYSPALGHFPSSTVSQSKFVQWSLAAASAPTAQAIVIARGSAIRSGRPCSEIARLYFPNDPKPFAVPEGRGRNETTSTALARSIVDELSTDRAQVLVVDYYLPYPLFPDSFDPSIKQFKPLRYKTELVSHADRVAAKLSPFVAVHWRTETLPVASLGPCTDGLVESLQELKLQRPTLRHLYLATDFSLAKTAHAAHSGSYKPTEEHAVAFAHLVDELKTLNLTVRWGDPNGKLAAEDRALPGLVDKLVAERAEVFLSGAWENQTTCGKTSSFTGHIVWARQRSSRALWNVVDTWGMGV